MKHHARALFAIAAVASFFALVTSASAAYVEIGSFAGGGTGPGGSGSEDGQLSNPGQADLNDATGYLYVADTGNNRVEVFKPNATGGEYDSQAAVTGAVGLAIDQDNGNLYVATATGISKLDSSLTPVGAGWSDPGVTGTLAVDPTSGDLLVADQGASLVRRFNSDGSADGSFAAERPLDLAVDSSGEVLVVTSTGDLVSECSATSTVRRYSAAGVEVEAVGASLEAPGAVAVDPDDDSIAVASHTNQYNCGGPNPSISFFDSAGSSLGETPLASDTIYAVVPGLAAGGGGSPRIYAVTRSPLNDSFSATKITALQLLTPPEVTIDPAAGVTATEAELSGTVDANGKATEYAFEYRLQGTSGWSATPSADAGTGEDPVSVTEQLTGLQPASGYEVKLVATNADGEASAGPVPFATETSAPQVEALAAGQLEDDAAWLRGQLNPGGIATTYRFEYGTTTAYGSRVPVASDASAGKGSQAIVVAQPLQGLTPGTTYHYRLVANNAKGTVAGADATFTTPAAPAACPNEEARAQQGSQDLPECRAYELVSPARKFGYEVGGNGYPEIGVGVSNDGERITYRGSFPLEGVNGGSNAGLVANRGADSWSNGSLLPRPSRNQLGFGFPGADATLLGSTRDGSTSVYFDTTTPPYGSLNVVREDGSRQKIADGSVLPRDRGLTGQLPGQPWFQGISPDGRHVLFVDTDPLVPGVAATGNDILYEWIDDGANGGAGTLRVVNLTNGPTPTLIDNGHAALGGAPGPFEDAGNSHLFFPTQMRHAVSADGSRIFFQNPAPPPNNNGRPTGGGPVYMREGGAVTTELSAPEAGYTPANPPTLFQYLDASVDGDVVIFWANGDLTDDASPVGGIYRVDTQSGAMNLLAEVPLDSFGRPPTAMASDDGSRLYFQDSKTGEVWLNEGGQNRFIAEMTITSGSFASVDMPPVPIIASDEEGIREDACASANVSPDGRYFVFSGRPSGSSAGARELQVYRFDAATDDLKRVSISPTGPSSNHDAGFLAAGACGQIGSSRVGQARVMSADGRYVFFDTTAALVPSDSNRNFDTYRWDAAGGHVALISSGTGDIEFDPVNGNIGTGNLSMFLGTDEAGRNAFFVTQDALVPQDGDTAYDIYSARIGGGFPVAAEADCEGEACQPSGGGRGAAGPPGSSLLRSPGKQAAGAVLLKPTAAQKRALAAGRAAVMKVRTSRAGRLTLSARAKIGGGSKLVGRASTRAPGARTVSLRLRLSKPALRQLSAAGKLRLSLSVALAGVRETPPLRLTLAEAGK